MNYKLNYKEINQKDLFSMLSGKYRQAKSSSREFPKFEVRKDLKDCSYCTEEYFDDVVLFKHKKTKLWRWFFQGDPSKTFSIVDGILEYHLWNQEDFIFIPDVDGAEIIDTSEHDKLDAIIPFSFNGLNLLPISVYHYRKFPVKLKTMYLKDRKALALPLYHLDGRKVVQVGLWAKMPNGKNPYIRGQKGVALHSENGRIFEELFIGESILDCLAFAEMKKSITPALYISTQGSISKLTKNTILNFIEFSNFLKITTLFDNDKAGEKYRKQVEELIETNYPDIPISHKVPKQKDFLDDWNVDVPLF